MNHFVADELLGAAAVTAVFVAVWVASVVKRDASIVDPLWPIGFVVLSATGVARHFDDVGTRRWVVFLLLCGWALRLGGYLLARSISHGQEDHRYQAMRSKHGKAFWWKSLFTVFLLQAALCCLVAQPLVAMFHRVPASDWTFIVGIAVFAVGLFFEAVGDWQLSRFKSDPSNDGKVMDRGLWRYTRHPNYFGDFMVWWGLALASGVGFHWSLAGPVVMSILLLKVSGVSLLEKTIEERRPAYADYKRRTNAFFPGPPKCS